MARDILPPDEARTVHLPAGVQVRELPQCDEYRGTVADILAAKIIRQDQIPQGCQVTYYKGVMKPRHGPHARRDEHYLCITKSGATRLIVHVGVSADVQAQREAREREERRRRMEEEERVPQTASGFPLPKRPASNPPCETIAETVGHQFPVGADLLDTEGHRVRIVQRYGLCTVKDEDGALHARYGYVGERGQKSFFFTPGDLYDEEGSVTHLRLVHSA